MPAYLANLKAVPDINPTVSVSSKKNEKQPLVLCFQFSSTNGNKNAANGQLTVFLDFLTRIECGNAAMVLFFHVILVTRFKKNGTGKMRGTIVISRFSFCQRRTFTVQTCSIKYSRLHMYCINGSQLICIVLWPHWTGVLVPLLDVVTHGHWQIPGELCMVMKPCMTGTIN